MRALPSSLIGLTPGTLRATGADARRVEELVVAAVRAAARGGLDALLLREPFLEDGAFLQVARAVRASFDGWLGLHDRVHLVAEVGADGAHLTGRSLPPREAREVLGGVDVTLSLSTHAGDEAPAAGLVDFVLHAPVFAPHSKDASSAPLGPRGITGAAAHFGCPVVALGGVDAERVLELAETDASGAAAIGALWGTDQTPIDGMGRTRLMDSAGIEARTRDLTAAARATFEEGAPR